MMLSSSHRDDLLRWSWLLIERPNIGYDFGGYREAILHLHLRSKRVERLALFNDSCWFPIPATSNWLEKAEMLDKDLVGSVSDRFIHPKIARTIRRFRWNYSEDNRKFRYCSFALLFSDRVVGDPQFVKFWKRYPLLSSKRHVVRYGETGITQWIKDRGYSHSSTTGCRYLDDEFAAMTWCELKEVLRNMVPPQRRDFVNMKERMLNEDVDGPWWKDGVVPVMLFLAYKGQLSYSLPDYLIRFHDVGFLKKAIAKDGDEGLSVIRGIVARHGNQCGFDLHCELEELINHPVGRQIASCNVPERRLE